MSVTISINIQIDATDPAAFDAQLAAISRNLFGRAALSCTPVAMDVVATAYHADDVHGAAWSTADGLSLPKPPDGPEAHRTPVLAPDVPAAPAAPRIAAIPLATKGKDEGGRMKAEGKPAKQPRSGDRLPFDEFDKLVAKELKRLSIDGRISGAGLWDEQRDKRLPTYGAVMQRYGCTNLASFAEKMGMQPPLSKAFTVNHNGANAIYDKEMQA